MPDELDSDSDHERTRKRPRNNAAPNELDGALAIINREIEAASASKTRAADTEARLRSVEEELETLRAMYAVQGDIMRTMKSENARLKLENEAMKKRLKTYEEMAHRVLHNGAEEWDFGSFYQLLTRLDRQ
jgi:regulator of replication initiation timing